MKTATKAELQQQVAHLEAECTRLKKENAKLQLVLEMQTHLTENFLQAAIDRGMADATSQDKAIAAMMEAALEKAIAAQFSPKAAK